MDEEANNPAKKYNSLKEYVKAEQMVQLALAIPVGCVLGMLFGSWLDRRFHTGWISIAGIFIGAAGGFVQIFTVAARYMKNNR
jgi:F0F1-type ATP synthase assembly protein I